PTGIVSVATLTVYLYDALGAGPHTITAWRVLRAWPVSTVTYDDFDGVTPWTTPGGTGAGDIDPVLLGTVSVDDTPGWFTIDLDLAWAQGVIDGSFANEGVLLERTDGANDSTYRSFLASDGAD